MTMKMRNLSKSKLIAYQQCPKRLWLEVHHPELRKDTSSAQPSFEVGNAVGAIARQLYDPAGNGILLDAKDEGFDAVFRHTTELLASDQPIFEAGFAANGTFAFSDILLPDEQDGKSVWRMIEIKSSTKIKDYHRDDAALQSFIARNAGVPLASIALAHINSDWVYQGNNDYQGLLKECDLTTESFIRDVEINEWIAAAHETASNNIEPKILTGGQCKSPFVCGFQDYCRSQEPQAKFPVQWLPDTRTKALKKHIAEHPALDLRDTPVELLNELQKRVKAHTLSGEIYFDAAGAASALKAHSLPAYFLDFESIQFAVPIWKDTSPYQQIPFQFSLHLLKNNGELESKAFLDLSGNDPSQAFAESLIGVCGSSGPIFVYNAGFEGARIKELAERFPDLAMDLLPIKERLVDLHPITKKNYYHPSQHGKWSIKDVLPAVAPDLNYETLQGVQNGTMAMGAYLEAIHAETTPERKAEINRQLLAYCGLDTFAMVRLWQFLAG